ncbi:MAG: hypothetical protein ABI702_03565 [Burkholderiales bacterium]
MNVFGQAYRRDGLFDAELTRLAAQLDEAADRFVARSVAISDIASLWRSNFHGAVGVCIERQPTGGGTVVQVFSSVGRFSRPDAGEVASPKFAGYLPLSDLSADKLAAEIFIARMRLACPDFIAQARELGVRDPSNASSRRPFTPSIAGILGEVLRETFAATGQPQAFERVVAEWLRQELDNMFTLLVDRRWIEDPPRDGG